MHRGVSQLRKKEDRPNKTKPTNALQVCVTHMTWHDGRVGQLREPTNGHVSSIALEAQRVLLALDKHWAGCERMAEVGSLLEVLALNVEGCSTCTRVQSPLTQTEGTPQRPTLDVSASSTSFLSTSQSTSTQVG